MIDTRGWHQAAGVFVIASTLAVWFLVGQLSEEEAASYIYELPQPGRLFEVVAGAICLGVAIIAAATVLRRRDLLIRERWWPVYGRLLAAGVLAAAGGRIITAGVNGANIGGAGILIVGPFPLLYALERTRHELRRRATRIEPNTWSPSYLNVVLTLAELVLGATLLWLLTPHRGG